MRRIEAHSPAFDNRHVETVEARQTKQAVLLELKITDKGYVGVQGGIKGLLKMEQDEINNYKFQYTSQDMSKKRNWIEIKTFKNIVRWVLYHEIEEIDWKGSFHSEIHWYEAHGIGKKEFKLKLPFLD